MLGRFSRSIPPSATLRTSRSRRSASAKLMIVIARPAVLARQRPVLHQFAYILVCNHRSRKKAEPALGCGYRPFADLVRLMSYY